MSLTAPMSVTALDRTEVMVNPNRYDDLDALTRHALDVRAVNGDTVTWHREPSDAHKALAASILGRALNHRV